MKWWLRWNGKCKVDGYCGCELLVILVSVRSMLMLAEQWVIGINLIWEILDLGALLSYKLCDVVYRE